MEPPANRHHQFIAVEVDTGLGVVCEQASDRCLAGAWRTAEVQDLTERRRDWHWRFYVAALPRQPTHIHVSWGLFPGTAGQHKTDTWAETVPRRLLDHYPRVDLLPAALAIERNHVVDAEAHGEG